MHYYQFNIKDWHLHTSHLDLEEEAIYFRLINFYYDTESPIPKETQSVFRRLRLGSIEKANAILKEFFTLTKKGWVSRRCEEEIKNYQKFLEKQKLNGKKGGRPSKYNGVEQNPKITSGFILDNPNETQDKPKKSLTNTHKPIPNTHKPIIKTITPSGVSDSVFQDFLKLRKSLKAPVTETALKGIEREALKAKISLEEALSLCCARGWRGFKAEWVTADISKGGGLKDDKSWMFTNEGIDTKAKELGITPTGYDSYQTLKDKCIKKIAERMVA